ncbi:Stomatin-like protein 2 mitochondrial, partial [Taenia solium]
SFEAVTLAQDATMNSPRFLLRKSNLFRFAAFARGYRTPINTGILFVPERQAWIVERLGKFHSVLSPGLNFCIPFVDRIAYVQSLKEIAIDIPDQAAITSDNVVLQLNGVLFLKVMDPYKASYGVEDAEFAITQLAQTTMRSEIGKIPLDNVFKEREALNYSIVRAICKASEPWGIVCLRYEIRDIQLPAKIKDAMQMQVEADRRKRAAILESEGQRDAEINRAEGIKQRQILSSEGQRVETINKAAGEAEAIMRLAQSRADAVRVIASAIAGEKGVDAVQMAIAERYIDAFSKLAKTNNTMLLPTETGDVSTMVAKALAIFKSVNPEKTVDETPLVSRPILSSRSYPTKSSDVKGDK